MSIFAMFIALVIVLVLNYCDLFLLKKENKILFNRVFYFSNRFCYLYSLIILLLIFPEQGLTLLFTIWLLVVFPIYLIRRQRFRKASHCYSDLAQKPLDRTLSLAIDSLGVVLFWFVGMFVLVCLVKGASFIIPILKTEMVELIVLSMGSSFLMIYLMYRTIQKYSDIDFRNVIAFHQNDLPFWKWFVVPMLSGLLFAFLSASIVTTREIQPITPLQETINATSSSMVLLAFVCVAIFLAPLLEEVIFRGFFFYTIGKFLNRMWAIGIIASIFALLHMPQYWGDWAAIGMVSGVGFVLTIIRSWSGSTLSSTIAHYAYNGGTVIFSLLLMH